MIHEGERPTSALIEAAIAGDAKAVRRLARAKHGNTAAALARVALQGTSAQVVNLAGAALARRKRDTAAIGALARLLCETPAKWRSQPAIEWAATALGTRKEPAAVAAAIASYRKMRPGTRARYFLIQALTNRTERDRALRANAAFVDLLLEVVRDRGRGDERAEAMWALARIANPQTTPDLIALLADRDAYIQKTAARALVMIARADGLDAVQAFVERCSDPELVDELTAGLRKARRRRS